MNRFEMSGELMDLFPSTTRVEDNRKINVIELRCQCSRYYITIITDSEFDELAYLFKTEGNVKIAVRGRICHWQDTKRYELIGSSVARVG